jgi:hypothetical protein
VQLDVIFEEEEELRSLVGAGVNEVSVPVIFELREISQISLPMYTI